MDPAAALVALGFSEYEARAYVALARHGPLNGYEVAKHSGVPRANIYAALERLERRNVVSPVREGDATRYYARPQAEFMARMRRERDQLFERAGAALSALKPADDAAVLNIRGNDTVMRHAAATIESVRNALLLAVQPREARALTNAVEEAEKRGVDVTTLCMAGCESECGGCRGRIFRYRMLDPDAPHWLLVVADRARVLAAEVDASDASAIEATQALVAELAAAYIHNTIALATLMERE